MVGGNTKKIFIIGDSHSAYLSEYLNIFLTQKKFSIYQFSTAHCTPLSILDKSVMSSSINKYIFEKLKEEKPNVVIVFGYYSHWSVEAQYGEAVSYDSFIKTSMHKIESLGVKKILLIGHIPTWGDSLPHVLSRRFLANHKSIPNRTYDGVSPTSLEWDDKIFNIRTSDSIHYLSLRDLLCTADGCITTVGPNLNKDLIVFDYGHLTYNGAKFITDKLISNYFD